MLRTHLELCRKPPLSRFLSSLASSPPPPPHPEITEQTPHNSETTFAPINLPQALQHQPILILNAQPLANETREGEIALTLSELIWDTTCPDEDPRNPQPPPNCAAPLNNCNAANSSPHRALLLTDCEHPTPELISFCAKLTGVIAIAILTEDPLDAPLKGFPPNKRESDIRHCNLVSRTLTKCCGIPLPRLQGGDE
ncbi:hypothetical protein AP9108_26780 [Arthrospira sp. PCC 9108]|nr:hypothetical protein AP9108_26780 [Arthrospira sp. PCC 9108]